MAACNSTEPLQFASRIYLNNPDATPPRSLRECECSTVYGMPGLVERGIATEADAAPEEPDRAGEES
jgi:hypothetical protein